MLMVDAAKGGLKTYYSGIHSPGLKEGRKHAARPLRVGNGDAVVRGISNCSLRQAGHGEA
jgi:hypothetical protein